MAQTVISTGTITHIFDNDADVNYVLQSSNNVIQVYAINMAAVDGINYNTLNAKHYFIGINPAFPNDTYSISIGNISSFTAGGAYDPAISVSQIDYKTNSGFRLWFRRSSNLANTFVQQFSVTLTVEFDIEPNPFSFADVTNLDLSTYGYSSAFISGIDTTVGVAVNEGTAQVSTDQVNWSTSTTIANNTTLYVRNLSASTYSTKKFSTIFVGSVAESFMVETKPVDTATDPFSFDPVENASLSTQYYSSSNSTTL